jgi:hypothetical protein
MQALAGHVDKIYTGMTGQWWVGGVMDHYYVFTGETSDWDSRQTFTFEEMAKQHQMNRLFQNSTMDSFTALLSSNPNSHNL